MIEQYAPSADNQTEQQSAASPLASEAQSSAFPDLTINSSVIVLCLEGCHGVGKSYVCDHFARYVSSVEGQADRDITFLDEAFMSAASPTKTKKKSTSSAPSTPERAVAGPGQGQGSNTCSPLKQQTPDSPQKRPLPQLMHPQSAFSELAWLNNWFQRIMLLKQQHILEQQSLLASVKSGEIPRGTPQFNAAVAKLQRPKLFCADRSPFSCCFYTRNGRGNSFMALISSMIEELKQDADIHIYTLCLKVSNREVLWNRISERLKREPIRLQFNENSREWMNQVYEMYETFPWDFTMENDGVFAGKSVEEVLCRLEESVSQRVLEREAPHQPAAPASPIRSNC